MDTLHPSPPPCAKSVFSLFMRFWIMTFCEIWKLFSLSILCINKSNITKISSERKTPQPGTTICQGVFTKWCMFIQYQDQWCKSLWLTDHLQQLITTDAIVHCSLGERDVILKMHFSIVFFLWLATSDLPPLRWRHNGHDSVSNHQPRDCFLNRLFRRRSKKTSKLCVTGLCAGNSPEAGEFPAQMASNAENVSIWLRHHADSAFTITWHRYEFWYDQYKPQINLLRHTMCNRHLLCFVQFSSRLDISK